MLLQLILTLPSRSKVNKNVFSIFKNQDNKLGKSKYDFEAKVFQNGKSSITPLSYIRVT